MKENNDNFDISFHNSYIKSAKKSSLDEKIDKRFDDVVARIDASQRSEASMHQALNFLACQLEDLKRQLRDLK